MTRIRALPTMAELQAIRRASQKPQPRVLDKAQALRTKQKAEAAFRAAVWKRDDGRCQVCHRRVMRTTDLTVMRGEVHHIVKRSRSKAKQLDTANGILLCAVCHAGVEAKRIHL